MCITMQGKENVKCALIFGHCGWLLNRQKMFDATLLPLLAVCTFTLCKLPAAIWYLPHSIFYIYMYQWSVRTFVRGLKMAIL
jgi:hypothetical protein